MLSHFVCDYPLQSDWIARSKSRHAGPPAAYDPKLHGPVATIWPWVLTAHAATHAAGVYVVTQRTDAALLEWVAHWMIDFCKCERWFGIHTDQCLHLLTKVAILWLVYK
jgi:hypothetical protein